MIGAADGYFWNESIQRNLSFSILIGTSGDENNSPHANGSIGMKVLAFSDFRVQHFKLLGNCIREEKPDLLLYAGDDLDRFGFLSNTSLLVLGNKMVNIELPQIRLQVNSVGFRLTPPARQLIAKMLRLSWSIRTECDKRTLSIIESIPFRAVRGNDDSLELVGESEYLRLFELCRPFSDGRDNWQRYLRLKGQEIQVAKVLESSPLPEDSMELLLNLPTTYGNYEHKSSGSKVSILGIPCTRGLRSTVSEGPEQYADIYLSHIPPLGVLDLSMRYGLEHIGSHALRAAILRYNPRIVICGHSHMWGGHTAKLGATTILNLSNGDRAARDSATLHYATINTRDWGIEVKELIDRSRTRMMGFSSLSRRINEDFQFVDERNTNKEVVDEGKKRGIDVNRYELRVKSMRWKSPKILGAINLPPLEQSAYLDVETGSARGGEPGKLILVGIMARREVRQFLWPKERESFFTFLKENDIRYLIHWTSYDRKALQAIVARKQPKLQFVDACQRVGNCVVWHSYSLGELHKALFNKTGRAAEPSGRAIGIWASHVVLKVKRCKYCPSKSEILKAAKAKNRQDLLMMDEVCSNLVGMSEGTLSRKTNRWTPTRKEGVT